MAPNLESGLIERFLTVLKESAGMKLKKMSSARALRAQDKTAQFDAVMCLTLPIGGEVTVAAIIRKELYPRDVRALLHKAQSYKTASGVHAEVCLMADYISTGSRKDLKEVGINYFDSTGSMYFKHRTCLVVRDFGPKERAPRRIQKLFTGAREQVVHALLEHWRTKGNDDISGSDLSKVAETSTYTVSLTMQELEREDWVETDWKARRQEASRWYIYTEGKMLVDKLTTRLSDKSGWAFTGAAAANIVVPHLTSVDRAQLIVPPGQALVWAEQAQLKPAEQGANVVLIERDGASIMFTRRHPERPGAVFASPFIQYLDLLDGYGRNKELADEFRRRTLKEGPSE
jgi:hypothetical protein